MPETAWATGGDPLNGFMQGFSVGALNHKGEKILGDDGKTELILGCDDVIVYGKYAGPIRYIPISEKGLESVHPEFDLLMIGRAAYNSLTGLYTNSAAKGGTTVLGHYPEYVNLAKELGARRFNIPTSVWENMDEAAKWAANRKFLDRMILRKDNIRLATPLNQVKSGSFYQMELNYLFGKGYKISADGFWLIK